MYINTVKSDWDEQWVVPTEELEKFIQWREEAVGEPLEVTLGRIARRPNLEDDDHALTDLLREALYEKWRKDPKGKSKMPTLENNRTLCAIKRLLEFDLSNPQSPSPKPLVSRVLSYNYDDLIETVSSEMRLPFFPVWEGSPRNPTPKARPCYHVHGYVPPCGEKKPVQPVVLTEDHYHDQASNLMSWTNLIQIQTLSHAPGLMVGLSLSDRNIRRLLRATMSPLRCPLFCILVKSQLPSLGASHSSILDALRRKLDDDEHQANRTYLDDIGVKPLFVDSHIDVPKAIDELHSLLAQSLGIKP
jgi:hypothetical protein